MKELDDRVKQIKQDLQSDLEHSMGPLREENTQLRKYTCTLTVYLRYRSILMQLLLTLMSIFRRVQSLTEQLQDKDTEKPEGEFTGLLLD